MSKVFFLGSPYMGCNYVRTLLPMWANGWSGEPRSLTKPKLSPSEIRDEMMKADVVVFHRPDSINHHKMAIELKKMGKKIVFDNDDTFKDHDPLFKEKYEKIIQVKNGLTDSFVRNADLVTTSTKFLAKEYKKLNKNVVVLPNCVSPIDWRKPKRNEGKLRIGLIGSSAYYGDFNEIRDLIKDLSKKYTMVVFGLHNKKQRSNNPETTELLEDEYKFWDSIEYEQTPWVEMKDYFNTLNDLRLDLMLIPRKDNYFNRCKSNVKFLESAMCEVPVIASSFKNGPYEELDGQNGIKVKPNEWKVMVEMLIERPELRRQIGKNAKEYVLKNYSIKNNAHLWQEAYAKI